MRVIVVLGCVLVGSFGCGTAPPGEGQACTPSDGCDDALACVSDASGAPRCMRSCARGSVVCDDGAACVDLASSGAVCWLGGATPLGAGCTGGSQCERGGVCTTTTPGGSPVCAQACLPPAADFCASGETCTATTSGGGFCGTEG
jgi:hypothetical protein